MCERFGGEDGGEGVHKVRWCELWVVGWALGGDGRRGTGNEGGGSRHRELLVGGERKEQLVSPAGLRASVTREAGAPATETWMIIQDFPSTCRIVRNP